MGAYGQQGMAVPGIVQMHYRNMEDDFLKGSEKAIRMDYDLKDRTWKRRGVLLRIKKEPFACGSMRSAHMMSDLTLSEGDKSQFVAKISRDPKENRQVYFDDVEMQMEAKAWAEKFNEKFQKKIVDFLVAYVVELVDRPGRPVIGVENWVPGNYVKYNNNWDWNDDKRNTPQAFSHFTWEESKHKLLICDLQGVGDLWTDPQMHSADGQGYGKGNMGMRGIQAFLNNHRCNNICKTLKLPQVGKAPKQMEVGTILPLPGAAAAPTKAQDFALNYQQTHLRERRHHPAAAVSTGAPDRIIIQCLEASFSAQAGDAPDTFVVVAVGLESTETSVAYGTWTPVWQNARLQMNIPRDGTADSILAIVFQSANSSEAGEAEIIGAVKIMVSDLKDDEGYDDRRWPLRPFSKIQAGDTSSPEVGNLHLKIMRFNFKGGAGAPIPKPQKALPLPPNLPQAEISKIKIMVKSVHGLGRGEHHATAVVMVEGNQAQTKTGKGDNGVVRWDQKMAFPACSSSSYIDLKVFSRDASGASAPAGVEWSGRQSVVEMDMDRSGNVAECKVPIYSNSGEGGSGAQVTIQAWVTFNTVAPAAARPGGTGSQQGTVSC